MSGINLFFKERNAQIQLSFGIIAIIMGVILKLNTMEWIAVLIAIGMVLIAEMFNSCIEQVCDFNTLEIDPRIKVIKDMAAGAVLIAALISIAIACFVFIPKLL